MHATKLICLSSPAPDPDLDALIAVRQAAAKLVQLAGKTESQLAFLAHQAMRIDETAAPHLDLLWRRCIATGDEAELERLSLNAKRYCHALADIYGNCVRRMMRQTSAPELRGTLLLLRAMHAMRTLFKWQWLRYEPPSAHHGNLADVILGCAWSKSAAAIVQRIYPPGQHASSVEREYGALRHVERLRPLSMSARSLDVLDRAADGPLGRPPRRLLREEAAPAAAPGRRPAPLPHAALMCCGGGELIEALPAMRPDDPSVWRPCVLRAHGDGYRVGIDAAWRKGLRIGALMAVARQGAPPALALVRDLLRDSGGNWEAGIEMLSAAFIAEQDQ
jgi:hypothetical protein